MPTYAELAARPIGRFGPIRAADADGRPGHYYVTVRDERGRVALAAGPWTNSRPDRSAHLRALGWVRTVMHYVNEHDPNGCWYAYGTSRLPLQTNPPKGKLNERLGL